MPKEAHPSEEKPKHDKPRPHDDRKAKGEGSGPKERELATELTIAVLRASAFPKNDPMAVADATADIYRKMLDLIGPAGPRPAPQPRP